MTGMLKLTCPREVGGNMQGQPRTSDQMQRGGSRQVYRSDSAGSYDAQYRPPSQDHNLYRAGSQDGYRPPHPPQAGGPPPPGGPPPGGPPPGGPPPARYGQHGPPSFGNPQYPGAGYMQHSGSDGMGWGGGMYGGAMAGNPPGGARPVAPAQRHHSQPLYDQQQYFPPGTDPRRPQEAAAPLQRGPSEPLHGAGEAPTSGGASAAHGHAGSAWNKPVKLYENQEAEQRLKDMADLFAIITATEHLETAWRRRSIKDEEYEAECRQLIKRFQATREIVKDFVPDIRRFIEEYNMPAKQAVTRLLDMPLPATVDYGGAEAKRTQGESARVAQTVHHFINATDSLSLNFKAVDQIHQNLADILTDLGKLNFVGDSYEGRAKLKGWITKLNNMKASDVLSDDEVRQLKFDLESSYWEFHRLLNEPAGRLP